MVTGPTQDPSKVYPEVQGIPDSYNKFKLGKQALTDKQREAALREAKSYHVTQKSLMMGYQCNQALNYSQDFSRYLDMHVNNIGDPFVSGNFTMNSKWMERTVLDYYAALWNARWPNDPKDRDSYWGFVLTMGCTEGNLYGMWNARDYLAGKVLLLDTMPKSSTRAKSSPLIIPHLVYRQAILPSDNPHAFTPIAFYSEDTHYSITKAMRMLSIRTFSDVGSDLYPHECPLGGDWPEEVPSQGGGEGPGSIDVDALVKLVEFFAKRGYPILICFNYGTTFKGAYDDVKTAGDRLMKIFKDNGLYERKVYYDPNNPNLFDVRTGFWFHVDGALGAAYMPFIRMASNKNLVSKSEVAPEFDFNLNFVHSIAMSGHKWIGSPIPTGVFMSKRKYQLSPPDLPVYIGSPDTTFAGSRNGLSAMLLWERTSKYSYEDQINKAVNGLKMVEYVKGSLIMLQQKLQIDLWVGRTPLALTVRFRQPNADIMFKYTLSGEVLLVNGEERKYAHVFMMEHVTKNMVDQLIQDLSQDGAFDTMSIIIEPRFAIVRAAPPDGKGTFVPVEGRGFRD